MTYVYKCGHLAFYIDLIFAQPSQRKYQFKHKQILTAFNNLKIMSEVSLFEGAVMID